MKTTIKLILLIAGIIILIMMWSCKKYYVEQEIDYDIPKLHFTGYKTVSITTYIRKKGRALMPDKRIKTYYDYVTMETVDSVKCVRYGEATEFMEKIIKIENTKCK